MPIYLIVLLSYFTLCVVVNTFVAVREGAFYKETFFRTIWLFLLIVLLTALLLPLSSVIAFYLLLFRKETTTHTAYYVGEVTPEVETTLLSLGFSKGVFKSHSGLEYRGFIKVLCDGKEVNTIEIQENGTMVVWCRRDFDTTKHLVQLLTHLYPVLPTTETELQPATEQKISL